MLLSFIVPAHNEELELGGALDAIRDAATDAGYEYEIVVADDSSTDATAARSQADSPGGIRCCDARARSRMSCSVAMGARGAEHTRFALHGGRLRIRCGAQRR